MISISPRTPCVAPIGGEVLGLNIFRDHRGCRRPSFADSPPSCSRECASSFSWTCCEFDPSSAVYFMEKEMIIASYRVSLFLRDMLNRENIFVEARRENDRELRERIRTCSSLLKLLLHA